MKTGSDLELDAYVIKRFSDTTDLRASNLECPQFNVCYVTLPYWASFIQKKYPGYCLVGCPIPTWVSDIHSTALKNGEQRVSTGIEDLDFSKVNLFCTKIPMITFF